MKISLDATVAIQLNPELNKIFGDSENWFVKLLKRCEIARNGRNFDAMALASDVASKIITDWLKGDEKLKTAVETSNNKAAVFNRAVQVRIMHFCSKIRPSRAKVPTKVIQASQDDGLQTVMEERSAMSPSSDLELDDLREAILRQFAEEASEDKVAIARAALENPPHHIGQTELSERFDRPKTFIHKVLQRVREIATEVLQPV